MLEPDDYLVARRAVTAIVRGGGRLSLLIAYLCFALVLMATGEALAQTSQPRTVNFPSADGKTQLVGYLFAPAGRPKTAPAVVLMHGRSGVYISRAKGNYSSVTIDKRLRNWAEFWSAQGYWALVVDSFGPRGYPAGIPANSDANGVGGIAARSLDAYGALRYLRQSSRIKPDRIAIEGWSGGASAALVGLTADALQQASAAHGRGFRAALAFFPSCGTIAEHFKAGYLPYAPVHVFFSAKDGAATRASCERLVAASKAKGADITLSALGAGAHDADDRTRGRQSSATAAAALAEARRQALPLLIAVLGH